MRLSNKLTFCLASLILLLALGSIYAATPVMAHATGSLDTSKQPNNINSAHSFPHNPCV